MSSAAGERLALFGWVVLAVVGAHALPVRERRLTDSDMKVRCPNDTSGLIPMGCSVELTKHQEALRFMCPYNLLEECTWSVNSQFIGSTHYPVNPQQVFAGGHSAVVSNFAQGQSGLTLSMQREASSLEGTEVVCSCQPRGGEQGPTRTARTVIAVRRAANKSESQSPDCYYLINDRYTIFTSVGCTIPLREDQSKLQQVFLHCKLPSPPRDGEALQWESDGQKLTPVSDKSLALTVRGNVVKVMEDVLMISVAGGDAFTALNGLSVTCASGNTEITSTFSA